MTNGWMRTLAGVGLVLALAGCMGGYSRFYATAGIADADIAAKRVAPAPATPQLEHAIWPSNADPAHGGDALIDAYVKRGYVLIGSSEFASGAKPQDADALAQGKRVGADLVVLLPPRPRTVTTLEPDDPFGPFFLHPRPYPGPWAFGPPLYGPGRFGYGPAMGWAAVRIDANAYAALYLVKIRWRLGALYRDLTNDERRDIDSNKGVAVSEIVDGSPAYTADILPGDVITAVNGQPTTNADAFARLVDDPATKTLTLTLRRGDKTLEKTVPLAF